MKKLLFVLFALMMFTGVYAQTLELYYYKQENQEGLQALLKAFTAANPGITINTLIVPNDADAAMSARAAQGKLPDILQMQSYERVFEYASKGYLVDLSKQPVIADIIAGALPAVTYKGKIYALPMDMAGIGIIYNKDIFAKLNITPPTTFRQLQAVAKTLKDNKITPFAGLLSENWSAGHFITMVHTTLLSQKYKDMSTFIDDMNAGKASYGTVDKTQLFAVLDFYRDNMDTNAGEMGWDQQQNAYSSGKAAMMVQGLWALPNPALKVNSGFIPFPVTNTAAQNKLYADVDSCFGLSAQSTPEKQAAALKFINWLSSPAAQKITIEQYRLAPWFKGANVSALPPAFTDMINTVNKSGSYPWTFSMYPTAVFEDSVKNGAQQYLLKKKAADKVISDIDAQWKTEAAKKR